MHYTVANIWLGVSAVREAKIDTQAGSICGLANFECVTPNQSEYTSFSHQMQPTWESLLLGEQEKGIEKKIC